MLLGIIAAIGTAVALGTLIAYVIKLTVKWLTNKVKEKLKKRNTQKVAVATLDKMIAECPNEVSLSELENQGVTHIMADVDYNGNVTKVDTIEDENSMTDEEIERMLGSEEMVVINAY